jgi:hypothetical protein
VKLNTEMGNFAITEFSLFVATRKFFKKTFIIHSHNILQTILKCVKIMEASQILNVTFSKNWSVNYSSENTVLSRPQ